MLPDGNGRDVPVKTKEQAEKAAEAIRTRIAKLDEIRDTETAQREIAKTRKLMSGMTIGIADIWAKYLESPSRKEHISEGRLKTMKMVFDKFSAWCEEKGLTSAADVTGETIIGFIREATKGLSSRSQWEYRLDLKTIFRDTYKQLGMVDNPAADIKGEKVNSTRREALTMEQVEKLLAGFDNGFQHEITQEHVIGGETKKCTYTTTYMPKYPEELRLVIMFALFSGVRCKDAVLMHWSNIDMNRGVISYTPAKTAESSGKRVEIPIVNDLLNNAIWQAESWKDNNIDGEDYVCPNVARWYLSNPTGVTASIGKCIEYATGESVSASNSTGRARKANRFGIHSLRHTFVSQCWNSGIRLEAIADLAGHQNPMITETYLHKDLEVQRAELRKAGFLGENITDKTSMSDNRQTIVDFIKTASENELEELIEVVETLRMKHKQTQMS
jgi:integrase